MAGVEVIMHQGTETKTKEKQRKSIVFTIFMFSTVIGCNLFRRDWSGYEGKWRRPL